MQKKFYRKLKIKFYQMKNLISNKEKRKLLKLNLKIRNIEVSAFEAKEY